MMSISTFIVLFLTRNAFSFPVKDSESRSSTGSPLDMNTLRPTKETIYLIPNVDEQSSFPVCAQTCSQDLRDSMVLWIKPLQSHVERYNEICRKYQDTKMCMENGGCDDKGFLSVLISGIGYMCNEQRSAFSHTINCIDQAAVGVQNECESECGTQAVFMKWIMQSGIAQKMMSSLQSGPLHLSRALPEQNGHSFQDTMRQISSDMCTVSDCLLSCMRNKFNTRCEGSAGSLLSEVFVRPIAKIQEKMATLSAIAGFAGALLPEGCRFLINAGDLAKHRVEPDLDQSLYKMYSDRDRDVRNKTIQDNKESNLSKIDTEELERKIKHHYQPTSPLDVREEKNNVNVTDRVIFRQTVRAPGNVSFVLDPQSYQGKVKCRYVKKEKAAP